MSLPQNVITVTTIILHHIYRPQGITVKFFTIPVVITVVPRYYRFPCYRALLHLCANLYMKKWDVADGRCSMAGQLK